MKYVLIHTQEIKDSADDKKLLDKKGQTMVS